MDSKIISIILILLAAAILVFTVIQKPSNEYNSILDKKTGEDIAEAALHSNTNDYSAWFEEHGYLPPVRIGLGKDGNLHSVKDVLKEIDKLYRTKGSAFVGEAWDEIWAEYGFKAPQYVGNGTTPGVNVTSDSASLHNILSNWGAL